MLYDALLGVLFNSCHRRVQKEVSYVNFYRLKSFRQIIKKGLFILQSKSAKSTEAVDIFDIYKIRQNCSTIKLRGVSQLDPAKLLVMLSRRDPCGKTFLFSTYVKHCPG